MSLRMIKMVLRSFFQAHREPALLGSSHCPRASLLTLTMQVWMEPPNKAAFKITMEEKAVRTSHFSDELAAEVVQACESSSSKAPGCKSAASKGGMCKGGSGPKGKGQGQKQREGCPEAENRLEAGSESMRALFHHKEGFHGSAACRVAFKMSYLNCEAWE